MAIPILQVETLRQRKVTSLAEGHSGKQRGWNWSPGCEAASLAHAWGQAKEPLGRRASLDGTLCLLALLGIYRTEVSPCLATPCDDNRGWTSFSEVTRQNPASSHCIPPL